MTLSYTLWCRYDAVRKCFHEGNFSLQNSIGCILSSGMTDRAVSKELQVVCKYAKDKVDKLQYATDVHVSILMCKLCVLCYVIIIVLE